MSAHNTGTIIMSSDYIITSSEISSEPTDSIGSTVFTHMQIHKDKVAQIDAQTGQTDTFGELLQRCVRTGLHMADKNVTREHIISTCSNNHLNSAVPYISTQFLGAIISPIDPSLSPQEMTHLLNLVRPRIIFTIPESVPTLEKIIQKSSFLNFEIVVFGPTNKHVEFSEFLKPHRNEEQFEPVKINDLKDTAVIHFSSGTTGLPKGICLSHYAYFGNVMHGKPMTSPNYFIERDMLKRESLHLIGLCYGSLYWTVGASIMLTAILDGYCLLKSENFDGKEIWNLIEKYKPAALVLTPVFIMQMLANRRTDVNVQCVACIVVVGSHFSKKWYLKCKEAFPETDIIQPYGQTETGNLTMFKLGDTLHQLIRKKPDKTESVGIPVGGISYKVVDLETNKNLEPNQQGELRIKSKFVTSGYYNQDSSEIFDEDGWYKTGDIVYYDEDYCFYIVDRIRESFKYQGWFIAPTFLENELLQHPAVKQAVVIGIPKEDGHYAMGLVVVHDNFQITEKEIEKFVGNKVTERQRLRGGVKFIASVPMTITGKVKRRELPQMVLDGKL